MAEKISTIILKVDLECSSCSKKIKRTLCKYQDRWNIKSIVYDEKDNTVTISGPFDPEKLAKKLCCKACNVIKDIKIVPPPPPPCKKKKPDPPPPPPPPPEETKPDPPPPPVETKPDPPARPPAEETKIEAEPPPPQQEVVQVQVPEPEAKAPEAVVVCTPAEPACPPGWPCGKGPPCCCWYHGTCRCCTCGRANGPYGYGLLPVPVAVVAPPTVVYGDRPCYGGYKTCELICEEDINSCTIM